MKPTSNTLRVEFGKPRYDWLPVKLSAGDFDLEFKASGLLDDPLTALIQCLLLVMQGKAADVSWWLELDEYRFCFSPKANRTIQLLIQERDELLRIKRQLFQQTASYEHIILPFWQTLQRLNPADFDKENWYPLPLEKLQQLTRLIRASQTSN